MRCLEYTVQFLTLCAAWSFGIAQDHKQQNNAVTPTEPGTQSDDDWDPQDFEEAQNYLDKFNYFHGMKVRAAAPAEIREAIEEMQDFNGIPRTGKLDKVTMAKMRSPRCGVADFVGPRKKSKIVRRRRRYALAGQKWPQTSLTYRILNYTPDLSRDQTRTAIKTALQSWSDYTPLTFREITRGEADIVIQFARGEHGDGYPFDGRGGTLAHAYFPGRGIGGDAHFDDHEYFSHQSYRGTNLFLVAAHELGHSLGLAHSSNPRALMAPYYQGYQPGFKLPTDDVKGIQRLYGKAPARPQPPTGPQHPNNPNIPNNPPNRPQPPNRPGTPNNPPHRPGNPGAPDGCGVTFGAAMSFDGRIYLFSGANYWRINENGQPATGYPKPITSYWRNAPSNIDAAFVMGTTENTVFFKGSKWYEYKGQNLLRSGTLAGLGLPPNVQRLDAAVLWEGNGMPYLFAGNNYYRFNEERGRVDQGYPKPITPNWVNIPGNVDAAFGNQGHTYFLKGQSYYKFDDNAIRRVLGPKDFGADWMKCTGRRNFSKDYPGSGATVNTPAKLLTVLFPLALTAASLLL